MWVGLDIWTMAREGFKRLYEVLPEEGRSREIEMADGFCKLPSKGSLAAIESSCSADVLLSLVILDEIGLEYGII